MSSEAPEEPHLRSEFSVLSPASPKPVHFPAPTNIPVLEMQMDVGFNQTEAHMSDPATRNTEMRPDFWRDPTEEQQQNDAAASTDYASPFSVGGEEATGNTQEKKDGLEDLGGLSTQNVTDSTETAQPSDAAAEHKSNSPEEVSVPTSASIGEQFTTNAQASTQSEQQSTAIVPDSSDPSAPNAEAASAQSITETATTDNQASHEPTQYNAPFNSGNQVDIQALLDTLQPPRVSSAATMSASAAPQPEGMTIATTNSPSIYMQSSPSQQQAPGVEGSPLSASALGVPPSGLPPRPPPQEQPLIHPNYVHSQHIRDYHPHAAHSAFQPHTRTGSNSGEQPAAPAGFVPPVASPSAQQQSGTGESSLPSFVGGSYTSNTSYDSLQQLGQQQTAAPGTTPQAQQSYPPAGYAGSPQSLQAPSAVSPGTAWATSPTNMYNPAQAYGDTSNTPIESRREFKQREGEPTRPEDRPWDAQVQRKYDRFIEEERRYVSEGRWEMFPQGSRLFVGNLSSEKVTKRDIFHVFHYYGELAQISIKQAYGFVQFLRTEDCVRALETEQGTMIRDKRIHLEVSKPQKNRTQNTQRRSRSPPNRAGSNVDRYTSGGRGGNSRNDRRDGYRPGYRSPSPRGGYRDRYDDRYRARSPSPNGYGRNGRYRSPSPRRDPDDDLPLPRRARDQVPDVQIIALELLDRDFITWVEQAFSSRSVKVDVLLLSPRLSEQAVVRRQIIEGVIAVVKLTMQNQNSGKIGLQVFDRRNAGAGGAENVRFEEYDQLDPPIAAELALRAKGQQAPQGWGAQPAYAPPLTQQQYGQQPSYNAYGAPPPQHASPPGPYGHNQQPPGYPPNYAQPLPQHQQPPPNLQSLITNLGSNNLQNLLPTMGTPQTGLPSAGGYAAVPPNSAIPGQTPQSAAYGGYVPQPPAAGAGGQGAGGQVNMQEILARLGSYQQR